MSAVSSDLKVLSRDQVAEYEKNGFLLVKNFIDLAQIEAIREEIEGLHERASEEGSLPNVGITWENTEEGTPRLIRQLMGSQHVSKTINDIIHSDKMIGAMEDLLGDEVELFHSKLMMKAANRGSFTPWHQDWSYWHKSFKRPALMNAFLAIDASTLENGCIRYVPGSHKEFLEHQVNKSAHGFGIGLPGDIDAYDAVPVEMEPGDVAFHDALCIHASEGNKSDKSRVMNTFAYTVKDNWLKK